MEARGAFIIESEDAMMSLETTAINSVPKKTVKKKTQKEFEKKEIF